MEAGLGPNEINHIVSGSWIASLIHDSICTTLFVPYFVRDILSATILS